jgi:osmotically inducible protein OsmC
VPDIDEATFERIAQATRQDCPVSRVLVAKISLEARLEREPL